jgi:hypothetical protein
MQPTVPTNTPPTSRQLPQRGEPPHGTGSPSPHLPTSPSTVEPKRSDTTLPPTQSEESGDGDDEDGPKTDPNPLNSAGSSIDVFIQKSINEDVWQQIKGGLPCLDATTACIAQLEALSTQKNPMLQEIDQRIEDISNKIAEAKKANKTSIQLSVFRPAAQVFLSPVAQPGHHNGGVLGKILSLFVSPAGVINEVLQAVGMPLFDSMFGGSDQNQQRAIAISDLETKLAEIQRSRAELADKVREKVQQALFDFDEARRDFQISQEVVKREASRLQLSEVEYNLGGGSSESYLGQLSALDRNKAQTWRAWTMTRSRLEKIKLLVLGVEE